MKYHSELLANNPTGSIGRESSPLSDIQILERLVADDPDCLFVSPLVRPEDQVGPSSLDIHMGAELSTARTLSTECIDLTASKAEIAQQQIRYMRKRRASADDFFVLHPHEFALGSSLEFFRFPRDIAGRLEGRSSLGRLGLLVHATAGFIDPGFEGTITFELINAGRLPIKLRPGIRLAQLCFFHVAEVQVDYLEKAGKYAGKLGVEKSKIDLDPEIGSTV